MTEPLYVLTHQYIEVASKLEDNPDPGEWVTELEKLKTTIHEKSHNIARLLRTWEMEADVIKMEEDRLKERRLSIERRHERVKEYLKQEMEKLGEMRIHFPDFTLRIQRNPPSVSITDEAQVPAKYKTVEVKIDKASMLRALKDGEEIPGAAIAGGGTHLRII